MDYHVKPGLGNWRQVPENELLGGKMNVSYFDHYICLVKASFWSTVSLFLCRGPSVISYPNLSWSKVLHLLQD